MKNQSGYSPARPWHDHPVTDILLGIISCSVGCFSGYFAFRPLDDAINLALHASPLPPAPKGFPFDPVIICQIVTAMFGGLTLGYFVLRPRVGPLMSLLSGIFYGYLTMSSVTVGQLMVPWMGFSFFVSHFGFVFAGPAFLAAAATADFLWSLLVRHQPLIYPRTQSS